MKLRINSKDKNTGNAKDKAIADAYGNKFIIPLNFEMLDSAAPYYQAGLGNRLCYEIMFNEYSRVINSTGAAPAPLWIFNFMGLTLDDLHLREILFHVAKYC